MSRLGLVGGGHTGGIHCVSRRGLLPAVRADRGKYTFRQLEREDLVKRLAGGKRKLRLTEVAAMLGREIEVAAGHRVALGDVVKGDLPPSRLLRAGDRPRQGPGSSVAGGPLRHEPQHRPLVASPGRGRQAPLDVRVAERVAHLPCVHPARERRADSEADEVRPTDCPGRCAGSGLEPREGDLLPFGSPTGLRSTSTTWSRRPGQPIASRKLTVCWSGIC